jgi:catechol 2,3-dioxygenase-like lactoylglutathione lyase family enzyme
MKDMITNMVDQFEAGKMSRRQLIEGLALTAAAVVGTPPAMAAAPAAKGFKATSINHLSFGVPDYAKARDFYVDLLGFEVKKDDGKQCYMICGDSSIVARKTQSPDGKTYIDHVCYTIANWDGKAVEAELKRRGLDPKPGANEFSYIVKDPNGFGCQIAGKPHCCEA